ncbi:hypothetical protein M9Y10_034106 [Tritrichomonas musculus]|uniref:IBR domain-containing protein n=1 Tax=Tritrichomonas musculus TaxID=1915356 RepID=A0ABR2KE24_9EUKA
MVKINAANPAAICFCVQDSKNKHFPGKCKFALELPPGFRICPGCKRPFEKAERCNHISCKCGKHFCHYCCFGPCDDGSPIYAHLSEKHGGCFNDPPDYMKYRLHK